MNPIRCAGATLVVAALLAGCGPGPIVRRGVVNTDLVSAVRARVAVDRQLPFTAQVPVRALGPDELATAMAAELERSFQPGDMERLEAVYRRLGLLPPDPPLRPLLQELYEGQVAGFYDPRGRTLTLATRALRSRGFLMTTLGLLTGHDLVGEMLVAHELTHALQDQHYGIPTEPEPLVDAHGDALLARRALLEGDATLSGFAYTAGGKLDAPTIDLIVGRLRGLPTEIARQHPTIPPVLRDSLAFQYAAGTAFAGRALTTGGWAAVDRAHRDPPASTEQVLHPERYFDVRDPPISVTVGGTRELEHAGWTPTAEDTLGELGLRLLASQVHPPAEASRVAAGWGGDRLRALARDQALTLIWLTAWDDLVDAAEFATAAPELLRDVHVEMRGRLVLLVAAPETVDPVALAARVWRESRVDGGPAR